MSLWKGSCYRVISRPMQERHPTILVLTSMEESGRRAPVVGQPLVCIQVSISNDTKGTIESCTKFGSYAPPTTRAQGGGGLFLGNPSGPLHHRSTHELFFSPWCSATASGVWPALAASDNLIKLSSDLCCGLTRGGYKFLQQHNQVHTSLMGLG